MDPISLPGSIAGLLSLTIELTKISYEYISGVRGAPKTISDFIRELIALKKVLSDLSDNIMLDPDVAVAFENGTSSVLSSLGPTGGINIPATAGSNILETCSADLTNILEKLKKKMDGKPFMTAVKRLAWPFVEEQTKKSIDVLRRYRETFAAFVAIDTLALGAKTHKEVKATRQELATASQEQRDWHESDLNTRILDWLSPLHFGEKQRDVSRKRHPGTGQWLLESETFSKWFGTSRTFSNGLWCPGEPGVGKTVIT